MRKSRILNPLFAVLIFQAAFIVEVKTQSNDGRAVGNKSVGEKRIALVIGNADYDPSVGKLKNTVNDAADMAEALKRLGFSLVGGKAQLNLNKRQMFEQIRDFGSQIKQGAVGLFYFAGHGVQIDRRNYLIPLTDSLAYQEDAEFEAVDVDAIFREMEYAGNALNILILDACRNNALPKKTRNIKDGLTEPNLKPSGVYIAFAARDGQTASENTKGHNGLYTQELLKNLETPNLRLEDIFINTRREVKRLSNRTQEPIEYGSLDLPFYLRKNVQQLSGMDGKNKESVFWNAIENSNDISDFEEYLRRVANGEFGGTFSATAELKITRLNKLKVISNWNKLRSTTSLLLKYEWVGQYSENLATACIGKDAARKCGYIDTKGKEIIPLKYTSAGPFSEGVAVAGMGNMGGFSDGKYGLIDQTGKEITSLKYNFVSSFSHGIATVCIKVPNGEIDFGRNLKCGFINKTGKEITPLKYTRNISFSEGLANVCDFETKKWGFISEQGHEIIPMKYSDAGRFSEGLAKFCIGDSKNERCGFMDKAGNEVIKLPFPNTYSIIYDFSEDLAQVCRDSGENEKCGFIDKTGKEVIPLKYTGGISNYGFSEGFAGICTGYREQKCGYIDKAGRESIPFKYNHINPFTGEVAWVCIDKLGDRKCGLIDKIGKELTPIKYDYIESSSREHILKEKFCIVGKGHDSSYKLAILSDEGKEITDFKYDKVWCEALRKEGFVGVIINGQKGFVDLYGNEYFDF